MNVAFTFKVCSGTGQSFIYLRQELIEFNTGIKYIRINTTGVKGGWGEWDRFVLNSDLKSLHTPIYGNVLTNTIPSKTFTIINSMNLSKGVYIIYGFAQYTTEFSEMCNYAMYQNDSLLAICRGTGTGGGGQTPFCILSLDNTATIKFGLYQPSSITREINYNRLIAVKLA